MKVLLDENFPLPLYRRLRFSGVHAEHLIALGQRGIPDSKIRERLIQEDLVFLTQDAEFEDLPPDCRAKVVISRVRQSLPISRRVEIWHQALNRFLAGVPAGKLFDLTESGEIVPWETHRNE